MVKQNINIINFGTLFNVLNEIKDNFTFNIFNYKNEDEFIIDLKNNKDITNSIIVVKSKSDILHKHSKIDERKIFIVDNLPVEINKFIEKINILLIRQRYDYQSKINIKNYILDINSRIIMNKDCSLKLTEREIDIILFLSENKTPQKINTLQEKIWGYSSELETHTVETHIYRLRKKIKDVFNDNKLINSTKFGYTII